jgi:hypothetical protein
MLHGDMPILRQGQGEVEGYWLISSVGRAGRPRAAMFGGATQAASSLLAQRPAVLDGLRYVGLADAFGAGQVGDRACHFQDPVIGPRRPVQARHCGAQQLFAGTVRLAQRIEFGGGQQMVGLVLALQLARMGLRHARCNSRRRLAIGLLLQILVRHRTDLDLHVDAVQQRPRDPALIVAIHKVMLTSNIFPFNALLKMSLTGKKRKPSKLGLLLEDAIFSTEDCSGNRNMRFFSAPEKALRAVRSIP